MAITQLIYSSKPFGFDDLSLMSILDSAMRNNQRDAITGALICREDLFLQLLEGRSDVVTAAYARICRDDRHANVVKQCFDQVDARTFPQWAMRHDPVQSWMWSRQDVQDGAVERASPTEFRNIFIRLSKQPPSGTQRCPMRDLPPGAAS